MTKFLYPLDSYLKEFTARVEKVDPENKGVILSESAFYPGGGGQPFDTGIIQFSDNELQVSKISREKNEEPLYWHLLGVESSHGMLPASALPTVGAEVRGRINWQRRYALMRTHTALHILCGVIWRDYKAQVTGGNMEPLEARMDFEFEHMNKELVHEIEEKINTEVNQQRPVVIKILSRKEAEEIPDLIRTKINLLPKSLVEIRTVEIEGLDLQADGGTHVANTSEVGNISIVEYKSKGKINKRLRIRLHP